MRNKKSFFRTCCLLFALIFSVAFLFACGQGQEASKESREAALEKLRSLQDEEQKPKEEKAVAPATAPVAAPAPAPAQGTEQPK
ncbi:MAG: hypothetical protein KKD47_06610 [Proteobacteria bacterium]|nr:hypothetical protein [Pseudomonadota bacterium]